VQNAIKKPRNPYRVSYHGRCISKEELEQALKEKGLLDGRDIKEIISEVDADNVIRSQHHFFPFFSQHMMNE
jgi:hypothetical protein